MKKLRFYLRLNAAFSLLSGGILSFASVPVGGIIGVKNQWILIAVGIGLILFSLTVYKESQRQPPAKGRLLTILALDTAWVVTSVVVVAAGLFDLSQAGRYSVVVVAAIVGFFALQQYCYRPIES